MTITAQEVITAARDQHAAFSDERTPNRLLLRQLVGYKRRLFQKITNVNPSVLQVLATDVTVDIATFNFDLGADLGAHLYILPDGEVEPQNEIDPGDRAKFWLISQLTRLNSRPLLSGWMRGNRLFLQGNAVDWSGFVTLHLSVIPIPTGPTALGDDFDPMPDSGYETLVNYCAHFMAKRGHLDPTLPPLNAGEFRADWATAEQELLTEFGLLKKARKIRTIDTFPGG